MGQPWDSIGALGRHDDGVQEGFAVALTRLQLKAIKRCPRSLSNQLDKSPAWKKEKFLLVEYRHTRDSGDWDNGRENSKSVSAEKQWYKDL